MPEEPNAGGVPGGSSHLPPVYRGFARIAATVHSVHAFPLRCGFRFGSAADGHGIPASFRARVIRAALCPASRWANIQRTADEAPSGPTRARQPYLWQRHAMRAAAARRRPGSQLAGTVASIARSAYWKINFPERVVVHARVHETAVQPMNE